MSEKEPVLRVRMGDNSRCLAEAIWDFWSHNTSGSLIQSLRSKGRFRSTMKLLDHRAKILTNYLWLDAFLFLLARDFFWVNFLLLPPLLRLGFPVTALKGDCPRSGEEPRWGEKRWRRFAQDDLEMWNWKLKCFSLPLSCILSPAKPSNSTHNKARKDPAEDVFFAGLKWSSPMPLEIWLVLRRM